MPWQLENGKLVIDPESGNPMFVYPDGQAKPYNADEEYAKVADLNNKLLKRRKKILTFEAIEKALTGAGIDLSSIDNLKTYLSAAAENASLVETFNDDDFKGGSPDVKAIEAKVEERYKSKFEKQKLAYEEKLAEANGVIESKDGIIHQSVIRNAFLGSEFIRKKTSFPHPDIAYDYLKNRFKVRTDDEGKAVGYGVDSEGDALTSITDPSKPADINEAIELVIKTHPQKESLLIPDAHGGSGGKGSKKIQQQNGAPKEIQRGDNKAFIDNLESIAKGETVTTAE